jgi:hypothetical protein
LCTWAEIGRPSSKIEEGAYASSGWRRPAHPATTGGDGGGEHGLGHEGAAGIPIEAKTGQRLTGNQASYGGKARAGRNGNGGMGRELMQHAGWSRSMHAVLLNECLRSMFLAEGSGRLYI